MEEIIQDNNQNNKFDITKYKGYSGNYEISYEDISEGILEGFKESEKLFVLKISKEVKFQEFKDTLEKYQSVVNGIIISIKGDKDELQNLSDENLKELSEGGYLKNIKALTLKGKNITNDGLRYLGKIEELSLQSNTEITDEGLKELKSIKILSLPLNEKITNKGVRYLVKSKKLKELNLPCAYKITKEILSSLEKMIEVDFSGIKKVNIVDEEKYKFLEQNSKLKFLYIGSNYSFYSEDDINKERELLERKLLEKKLLEADSKKKNNQIFMVM